MKKAVFFIIFLVAGLGMSVATLLYLPVPYDAWVGYSLGGFTIIFLCCPKKKSKGIRIGPFAWSLNDFCRGWLITGQTGSGKTACAIRTILHALYRDCPDWGGAVVDQKGQFYEIVSGIAKEYKLSDKLVILRVGSGETPARYNLLSYPGISWASYAALIVDTSESMGIRLEAFWKTKAEVLLRGILQMVAAYRMPTLKDLVKYTNNMKLLDDLVMTVLRDDPDSARQEAIQGAADVKGQVLTIAPATRDSILASAQTMVAYFADPGIQDVFCPLKNTVDFRDIDRGKIFVLSMEQKYDRQRIFFNTFLKLLFMTHAKYRFDDPKSLPEKNLLVFCADEAQQIVTSSVYASDHEAVSVIREAKATYILAAQSITSFVSRLKKEDVQTLILNLASKIYFTVADQDAAESAAKDLGVRKTQEVSKSVSKGVESTSTRETEKPFYSPAELRSLNKYQCVIKHPSGKTEKLYLPPRDDTGNIPEYYYIDRFGMLWYLPWLLQV